MNTTLTAEDARTIMEMEEVCCANSNGPDSRALIRLVVAQHPAVAADFTWVLDRHAKWTEVEKHGDS